jgi:hypothetical protein
MKRSDHRPVSAAGLARRAGIAVLGAALAVSASGCTMVWQMLTAPRVRECDGFDVPLSALAVSSRKELRVKVIARRVREEFPFVVESSADSFVLIAFTPLGTKAFTLVRHGDDVQVENLVGPAAPVPPRNVMADLLAMSVPSACATTPDGVAPSVAGKWSVRDTCHEGRPQLRQIGKTDKDVDVEVVYGDDAILVRQKRCGYNARYVLQAANAVTPAAPGGVAPAPPAGGVTPAAAPGS